MLNNILNIEGVQVLSSEQMRKNIGGRVSEYCASMYMVRGCNTLTPEAMVGWDMGWNNGGCYSLSGAALYEAAEELLDNPDDLNSCDFESWIAY